MNNSNQDDNLRFSYKSSSPAREEALEVLDILKYDLSLSKRTISNIKAGIYYYYEENPESRLHARTLVGILSYMVCQRNNEHLSIATIAKALDVNPSWLSRNKKRVLSVLQRIR
ncbi:MAG: hypothetical protein ACFFE8_09270 [Candidatus Heimdallarchaeota archaeon]